MTLQTDLIKPHNYGNSHITVNVLEGIVTGFAFPSQNSPTSWAKGTYVQPISPDIWNMTEQERAPIVRAQRHMHAQVADPLLGLEFRTNAEYADALEIERDVVVPPGYDGFVQVYRLRSGSDQAQEVSAAFTYNMGLRPASCTPLTSGVPIEFPENVYQVSTVDGMLALYAESMETHAYTSLKDETRGLNMDTRISEQTSADPIQFNDYFHFELTPGEERIFTIYTSIGNSEEKTRQSMAGLKERGLEALLDDSRSFRDGVRVEKQFEHGYDWNVVINSNLMFNLGSCTIEREDGSKVLITDPQILPLTWNRDNYYQARLFLTAYHENESPVLRDTLFSYLKELFDMQKPEGGWGRSHFVNGQVKDDIFQFDQNSYPILFLSEMDREIKDKTPEEQAIIDNIIENKLPLAVQRLMREKSEKASLFETLETPADDPTEFAYHLSTNVLAWKASTELAGLKDKYDFQHSEEFATMADQIKGDINRFFATKKEGRDMFFYETDLAGNGRFYFDANDLAFSLAPEWGFTTLDDILWNNTLDFAFSTDNERGYFDGGKYAGLGSIHTRSVWPLGFANEMSIAIQQEDKEGLSRVLDILSEIVQQDGTYSETVHVDTGKVHARSWFAWPGAGISEFLIRYNDRINEILRKD